MARFPGPFAYGVAGLGEGFTEGLFMGQEARRRKQEQERLKQGQAIQLLLGLFKATDDPDERQSLAAIVGPMYQKLSGQPLPQFPATPPEKRIGREVGTLDATITALSKAHPDWSPDFVRQAAMAMRGVKLPKQEKPAPPTFMRGPRGELIPLEPGTKVVGGSGYPPAWTQPQTYQPVDAYGQPAGPPLHMGGRDKPLVTPWARQETKPEKEPKPKSQKEQNYEAYVNHMNWIEQNITDPEQKKEAINKAMKRAARLGIISPKLGEMGADEE